jgi:chromosomal replication initiation ATPase DnaA
MTAKKSRSDTILKCLRAVADYYGIEPTKVLDRNQMHPSKKAMAARDVMYYHLRECGMEYHAIGRIFGRAEDTVRKGASRGVCRLMGEDRYMMENLPRIDMGQPEPEKI